MLKTCTHNDDDEYSAWGGNISSAAFGSTAAEMATNYLFEEGIGLEAGFRAIFRLKSATQLISTF